MNIVRYVPRQGMRTAMRSDGTGGENFLAPYASATPSVSRLEEIARPRIVSNGATVRYRRRGSDPL